MNALVVYESVYGNTRAVAEAIAAGLNDACVCPVSRARAAELSRCGLLVVGGPTHVHGMTTKRSRELAAEMARADGRFEVDPDADAEPGLRSWLQELPAGGDGPPVAAFDTRLEGSPLVTGMASHGIARRLRRRGFVLLEAESFIVAASEGPMLPGELDRARAWGTELAVRVGSPQAALAAGR